MQPTAQPPGPRAPRIVGLGGSLGTSSSSLAALKAVLGHAREAGAATRAFDVRALDLPAFDPSARAVPEAARELADAMYDADAIVWSAPMYHGTVSGSFKNALDWLQVLSDRKPAYLSGKPVALVATAAGAQGLQAINTMEFVVRALRGWTIPLVAPIGRSFAVFAPDGHILDESVDKQLRLVADETVASARRFMTPTPMLAPLLVAVTP